MRTISSLRASRIRTLILLLLTLGWLIFIFSNSLQSGTESGAQSKRLLRFLQDLFRSMGYQGELSEHVLRKLAHFGEFAILTFLGCLDLWSASLLSLSHAPRRVCLTAAASVLFCFCAACVDEFLQRFTPGRGPRFTDSLIDTAGGLCAYLCFLALFFLIRILRKRKVPTT